MGSQFPSVFPSLKQKLIMKVFVCLFALVAAARATATCGPHMTQCTDPTTGSVDCFTEKYQSMKSGVWCDYQCPTSCMDGHVICTDYDENGCMTQFCNDECAPPKRNSYGCLLDGTETCCDDVTENKCTDPSDPSKEICVQKGKSPAWMKMANTPTDCPADQFACPGSIEPNNNCPYAGSCVTSESDCWTDGNGCPRVEPVTCTETQMNCWTYDSNGCGSDSCIDSTVECKSQYTDAGCPVLEDVDCGDDMISCPQGLDADNCPRPAVCKMKDTTNTCDVCDPPCDEMTQDMCEDLSGDCPKKRCVAKGQPCWFNV